MPFSDLSALFNADVGSQSTLKSVTTVVKAVQITRMHESWMEEYDKCATALRNAGKETLRWMTVMTNTSLPRDRLIAEEGLVREGIFATQMHFEL